MRRNTLIGAMNGMASELDQILNFLRRHRIENGEQWRRKRPIGNLPPTALFDEHMEQILEWVKRGNIICTVSGESDSAIFASLLSDRATVLLHSAIADPLFISTMQTAPEDMIPWQSVALVRELEPLIREGRLRVLARCRYTGTMIPFEDPSWFAHGVNIQVDAPHWRQQLGDEAFHASLRKAKLITLGEVEIPIFKGIDTRQFVELIRDEPSLSNLRDAVAQTLTEIIRDPSRDRIEDLLSRFQREVRGVEREYEQVRSRRHNTLLGAGIGTGLLALGFLLPEHYASIIKSAASGLGSVTIWSASSDIWREKARLRGLPFYVAWKAHLL
jgi:hypothetical protein